MTTINRGHDPDMELIQRALLSDHRKKRQRELRNAVISDIAVVLLVAAVVAFVSYSGLFAQWLGVA